MQKFNFFNNKISIIINIVLVSVLIFILPFEFSQNRSEFSGELVLWDKAIQNMVIVWIIAMFFIRKFKFSFIALGLIIGFIEQGKNLFVNHIHPILLKYPNFYEFITHTQIQRGISSEYPRIIFSCLVVFSFFIFILIKKNRSFDRIFIFLISSSVLLTSFLFHFIIVKESHVFKEQLYSSMFVAAIEKKQGICRELKFKCDFFQLQDYDLAIVGEPVIQEVANFIKPELLKREKFLQKLSLANPDNNSRLIGQVPVMIIRTYNDVAIINAAGAYTPFLVENQFIYSYLALTAHCVWIMGGLFLIIFHRNRFSKRTKTIQNI